MIFPLSLYLTLLMQIFFFSFFYLFIAKAVDDEIILDQKERKVRKFFARIPFLQLHAAKRFYSRQVRKQR